MVVRDKGQLEKTLYKLGVNNLTDCLFARDEMASSGYPVRIQHTKGDPIIGYRGPNGVQKHLDIREYRLTI